jgi:hypothetical protein
VTAWADLTTFTIQFNISNLEIDYLFILLPHTYTHTPTCTFSAELDKSMVYAIPLVRPLPIPLLHDRMKMEVCFINFNKGEDDEGCFKFCNILKWSAIVYKQILKS